MWIHDSVVFNCWLSVRLHSKDHHPLSLAVFQPLHVLCTTRSQLFGSKAMGDCLKGLANLEHVACCHLILMGSEKNTELKAQQECVLQLKT